MTVVQVLSWVFYALLFSLVYLPGLMLPRPNLRERSAAPREVCGAGVLGGFVLLQMGLVWHDYDLTVLYIGLLSIITPLVVGIIGRRPILYGSLAGISNVISVLWCVRQEALRDSEEMILLHGIPWLILIIVWAAPFVACLPLGFLWDYLDD